MKPLIWTSDINERLSKKMLQYSMAGNRTLVLNSRGGETDHMCSIVDLMATGDWEVMVTGSNMSAAVPILAMGAKGSRVATPNTRFMIHLPRLWSFGSSTSDEMVTESEELRALEVLYCGVLGRRTKKTAKFWLERIRTKKDWYFGVKEALELGLIDSVVGFEK